MENYRPNIKAKLVMLKSIKYILGLGTLLAHFACRSTNIRSITVANMIEMRYILRDVHLKFIGPVWQHSSIITSLLPCKTYVKYVMFKAVKNALNFGTMVAHFACRSSIIRSMIVANVNELCHILRDVLWEIQTPIFQLQPSPTMLFIVFNGHNSIIFESSILSLETMPVW